MTKSERAGRPMGASKPQILVSHAFALSRRGATTVRAALLGAAACAVSGAGAVHAADLLPANKAAPVEYVRICEPYGLGFFYVPGTDTCLKFGTLALFEARGFDPSYRVSPQGIAGVGGAKFATTAPITAYYNQRSRDAEGYSALGRVELDSRTKTDYGDLRAFLRVDNQYTSGGNAAGGAGSSSLGASVVNIYAGSTVQRDTSYLNKGFVQFAGLTAGRAQSFFDFYADAYNYFSLRGSDNPLPALIAYTATFGPAYSASVSLEDQASRRPNGQSVINSAGVAYSAAVAGARVPDVVVNLRTEQDWGAAQLTGAAHQDATTLFPSTALAAPPTTYAFPTNSANTYGYAFQAGVSFKLDKLLSQGDRLWLQAAYEKGALSYINGVTGFTGTANGQRWMGQGISGVDYAKGWDRPLDSDCVWTGPTPALSTCQEQHGVALVAAFRHYWVPNISSAIYGSFYKLNYTPAARYGLGGGVGVTNDTEERAGAQIVWTPVSGLDIGGELSVVTAYQGRPVGLISDAALEKLGLPIFRNNQNVLQGRIRIQRYF